MPGFTYPYSEYIIKVEKIAKNFDNLFPDLTGEEITVLRGIYTSTDEKGNEFLNFQFYTSFPFLKGEEYYAYLNVREYNNVKYYMAIFDAFMVNDYRQYKELEPFQSYFCEWLNYTKHRKEVLEKYEGVKFD